MASNELSVMYDNVNRTRVIERFSKAGCGASYRRAISKSIIDSSCKIGNESIDNSSGVRQGGPLNCNLLNFFVDPTM